ncbi:AraC family transcriptional regulator [Pelagicoccus enzymogenes]|uniref:AraC family transcriptional regulator n=1 Tax=Pelagicoccus enzymogenes TaxID=2773457 RepID=UPI003CE541F6
MEGGKMNSERRLKPAEVSLGREGVAVIESHHDVDFEMAMGVWPFRKICWVAVGKGLLAGERRSHVIERGDFLLLPSGWSHRFVDDRKEPLTLVIICLEEPWFEALGRDWGELWNTAIQENDIGAPLRPRSSFHEAVMVELMRSALRENRQKRIGWLSSMQATVGELLVRFGRGQCEISRNRENRSERAVAAAIEYVDEHPYLPLRIEEMASQCQLSPRRFTDLFKRQSGESFNQYLLGKRVEYASQRLLETGHILYACYESGFNDPAYFYRVFKKRAGETPGQFLRNRRARGE